MKFLKMAVVGNVDDGKSTFVGKLLFDTQSLYQDQIQNIAETSIKLRGKDFDYSLITDGLKNERNKSITIDTAYRYFSFDGKRVVLIDCPGHEEFLPAMISGVSQAQVVFVMVDITKGVTEQTRRHIRIAQEFSTSSIIACINKMDVFDYSEKAFIPLRKQLAQLGVSNIIPMSAVNGDNITCASIHMPWYRGETVLEYIKKDYVVKYQDDCILVQQSFSFSHLQILGGKISIEKKYINGRNLEKIKVLSIKDINQSFNFIKSPSVATAFFEERADLCRGDILISSMDNFIRTDDFVFLGFSLVHNIKEKLESIRLCINGVELDCEINLIEENNNNSQCDKFQFFKGRIRLPESKLFYRLNSYHQINRLLLINSSGEIMALARFLQLT